MEEPTFSFSQAQSGWLATRKPATRSLAARVPSQAATGHSFQASTPL